MSAGAQEGLTLDTLSLALNAVKAAEHRIRKLDGFGDDYSGSLVADMLGGLERAQSELRTVVRDLGEWVAAVESD